MFECCFWANYSAKSQGKLHSYSIITYKLLLSLHVHVMVSMAHYPSYLFYEVDYSNVLFHFVILQVSGFSGDVVDDLVYHDGQRFTTRDNDNDLWGDNCAITFTGKQVHFI